MFGEHCIVGYRDRPPSAKPALMRKHRIGLYTSERRVRKEDRLNYVILNIDNGGIILTYDETNLTIQIEMTYHIVTAQQTGLLKSRQQFNTNIPLL
jgi:hypothetical protein